MKLICLAPHTHTYVYLLVRCKQIKRSLLKFSECYLLILDLQMSYFEKGLLFPWHIKVIAG
jgi:hypothetical protein